VFISIIGFGFLGGISGVMMGTEQLNMIIHNTIYVPGHFHATVVIGHHAVVHGADLLPDPGAVPREMINAGPGQVAALPVRLLDGPSAW
jgi:cytochrome c oxidase subunit 1